MFLIILGLDGLAWSVISHKFKKGFQTRQNQGNKGKTCQKSELMHRVSFNPVTEVYNYRTNRKLLQTFMSQVSITYVQSLTHQPSPTTDSPHSLTNYRTTPQLHTQKLPRYIHPTANKAAVLNQPQLRRRLVHLGVQRTPSNCAIRTALDNHVIEILLFDNEIVKAVSVRK